MIATPDEEVESAGIMAAVGEMVRLRDAHGLAYVGVINSDYTAPREPGDEARYVYRGSIGKMLACFYVRGCETHLGEVFRGLDANLIAANLIRETNLNVDLCDESEGEITVPPVTQKLRDFKVRYDAQIPIAALVHCSVLVHGWTPADVLSRMVAAAGRALSAANHRRVTQWSEYARRQNRALALEDLGGRVWTYGQLFEATEAEAGPALTGQIERRAFEALREARRALAPLAPVEKKFLIDRGTLVLEDSRERSLALVRALAEIAGQHGVMDLRKPAVVVYFAPPFFPPVSGDRPSRLNRAIAAEVETGAYGPIQFRSFYPYVSDISYMRVDEPVYESLPLLKRNFPLWRDEGEVTDEGLSGEFFTVPFDLIRELDCDVANIGPWGKEAHGKGERVHMPYSFETVPELMYNVILRLLGGAA
jgi:arginine utilization protein RocB